MKLLYLFLLILGLKFTINFVKHLQCKRYCKEYIEWCIGANPNLRRKHHQVIKLFKEAGVKDSVFPLVEPVGLGQIATYKLSIFDNFPNRTETAVGITGVMFDQAIGVYYSRAFETFNPFYWIEFIIYLPRNILSYIGVPTENSTTKVLQFFYWFVGSVLTLIYTAYSDEISEIIKNIVENFRF